MHNRYFIMLLLLSFKNSICMEQSNVQEHNYNNYVKQLCEVQIPNFWYTLPTKPFGSCENAVSYITSISETQNNTYLQQQVLAIECAIQKEFESTICDVSLTIKDLETISEKVRKQYISAFAKKNNETIYDEVLNASIKEKQAIAFLIDISQKCKNENLL